MIDPIEQKLAELYILKSPHLDEVIVELLDLLHQRITELERKVRDLDLPSSKYPNL